MRLAGEVRVVDAYALRTRRRPRPTAPPRCREGAVHRRSAAARTSVRPDRDPAVARASPRHSPCSFSLQRRSGQRATFVGGLPSAAPGRIGPPAASRTIAAGQSLASDTGHPSFVRTRGTPHPFDECTGRMDLVTGGTAMPVSSRARPRGGRMPSSTTPRDRHHRIEEPTDEGPGVVDGAEVRCPGRRRYTRRHCPGIEQVAGQIVLPIPVSAAGV